MIKSTFSSFSFVFALVTALFFSSVTLASDALLTYADTEGTEIELYAADFNPTYPVNALPRSKAKFAYFDVGIHEPLHVITIGLHATNCGTLEVQILNPNNKWQKVADLKDAPHYVEMKPARMYRMKIPAHGRLCTYVQTNLSARPLY